MTRDRKRLIPNVLASSLLTVLLVPAAPALAKSDIVQPDEEPIEAIVEQVEPAEKILGLLEAQAGAFDPAILGLDGAPLPHDSPFFLMTGPVTVAAAKT